MKLTTKGRYAVTAMLDLCCQDAHTPVALIDISKRQEISLSYLEQLFAKLRRRGLVRSVRGPGGGYLLMAPPSTISVADIIRAVDEPIKATSCDENDPEGCRKSTRCITHHLWERVGIHINSYLESIHLDTLIEEIRSGTLRPAAEHGFPA
ncbi:HTH-type transcriptional regulator IscR [Candidatus Magnetaquicoccaceae bacterium FCR-1]|uniref:HTH-type transcriptional regulator IscR n=1 Tax=Candidatus Magnetaquiglobus chichijimensis TaxID=3141448 RepID=A0ABQ0C937_9PROT